MDFRGVFIWLLMFCPFLSMGQNSFIDSVKVMGNSQEVVDYYFIPPGKSVSYFDNGVISAVSLADSNWYVYSYDFNTARDTIIALELVDPLLLIYRWREWYDNGCLKEVTYEQLCPSGMRRYGISQYYDSTGVLIKEVMETD